MKSVPVVVVDGGYFKVSPEKATHLAINIPGPVGILVLPVITRGSRRGKVCWTWNGSVESPTLKPSIKSNSVYPLTAEQWEHYNKTKELPPKVEFVCHLHLNDGKCKFLDDTTHEFRNQTVDLIDIADNHFSSLGEQNV